MTDLDVGAIASELAATYAAGGTMPPPSGRGLTLDAAYAVERELARQRHAAGHASVGRKVGYANKAVWRALKLETLVWADMYDDTVRVAGDDAATFAVGGLQAPKIEPEIVFRMARPLEPGTTDPAAVLAAVEWVALGFEIIDCRFPDWKVQPPDFVAAYGLHAALVVGQSRPVGADAATLADALASFTVELACDGTVVQKGGGRNSLRSPALCLGELASAIARRPGAEPLGAGELVSSGTLTESTPIAAGQTWTATLQGLDLPPLTLTTIP